MVTSYVLAIIAVVISSVSQVLLKKKADQAPKNFIMKFLNLPVIVSYILLFASMMLNSLALREMDVSVLPCITATSFLWIMVLSAIFLGEKPTRRKVIGVVMILVGVVVSHL
ncbi:MAG: EamA family transporter [Oscillospiraceae bacterium]|nr:EamA family transporter [Oscillospiraceae bacterium]